MSTRKITLFVPGRLCLFGEHSDWAGQYRRFNSNIDPGCALVCATEEGIYVCAEKSDVFHARMATPEGETLEFSCPFTQEELGAVARMGGFFSYMAGVAAHLLTYYEVGGISVVSDRMTLPLKKGLSSSAAICVATARAFNNLYNLNLTIRGEMEAAYHGEQLTPSRCGRLDQACAYNDLVRLVFSGDSLDAEPLRIGGDLHWVFADLMGEKDTIEILRRLSAAYPFPKGEREEVLVRALGEGNRRIVDEAAKAIEAGDAIRVGALMQKAQEAFDAAAIPMCPEQLAAPLLHGVLGDERVRKLSYGGKGVGSQGDGSAQFIARDAVAQRELKEYLESKGFNAYTITLRKTAAVRRAVVPAAGLGTRMYPATKAVAKELLPVVDQDGLAKPALFVLLAELYGAGIREIALIVRPGDEALCARLFTPADEATLRKLPRAAQETEAEIRRIGECVRFIAQDKPLGFGHAVSLAQNFAGGEPVLLALGDHLYRSNTERSCAAQLISLYEEHKKLAVSIAETPPESVVHYGIVSGAWEDPARKVLNISAFSEKPTVQHARDHLGVMCATREKFFAVFGQYILTPDVFERLAQDVAEGNAQNGEIQLTPALDAVCRERGAVGLRVEGKRYDLGLPEEYRRTVAEFGSPSKEERKH